MKLIRTLLCPLMVLALLLCGCSKRPSITIMHEQTIPSELLCDLAAQIALNDGIGVTAVDVDDQTKNGLPALMSGDVSVLVDSAQSLWMSVLEHEDNYASTDLETLNKELDEIGLTFLPFKNIEVTTVLIVRTDVAHKYKIESLEGLSRVSDKLILAADPEFYNSPNGSKLFLSAYNMDFKKLDHVPNEKLAAALEEKKADVIAVSSLLTGQFEDLGIPMEDRLYRIPTSPLGFAVTNEALKTSDRLKPALLGLIDKLDKQSFNHLIREAAGRPRNIEEIARKWLRRQALIGS